MKRLAILATIALGVSAQQWPLVTIIPNTDHTGQPATPGQVCFYDLGTPSSARHKVCLTGPATILTADVILPLPFSLSPAPPDGAVQINQGNTFAADPYFLYNKATHILSNTSGTGGYYGQTFNSGAVGGAIAFQTAPQTMAIFGGGWGAFQSVNTLGVTAAQGTSTPQGGYVRWTPVMYPPNGGSTCHDIYGNIITIPTAAPGDAPFGTNDLILWNGTSPLWSASCMGPALPSQLDYGLNLNGYFLAHDLASYGTSFAAGAIYSPDGHITGGWQGAAFYAGAEYPGNTLLTSIQDANSVTGVHMNNNMQSGGSGYVANDTGTIGTIGGSLVTLGTYKVLTVSGSAVATYSITAPGNGYTIPASAVTTTHTTGSGTGFTINLTGLTGSLYLAGGSYLGHSCGPPTANPSGAATIQNSTNPMPIGLGLQQGLHYYDDCLHTMRYLQDDLVTWVSYPGSAGGTAAGPLNAIQVNNPLGTFAGYAGLTYDPVNSIITLGNVVNNTSGISSPIFSGLQASRAPGDQTFQNANSNYAVTVHGDILGQTISLGGPATAAGLVKLYGGTSGYFAIQAGAAVTSYTWTVPLVDSAGCIASNGSGTLSIAACSGGSAALTSTYVGFGNGSNTLSGDPLLTFDDTNFIMKIGDPGSGTAATSAFRAPDLVCSNDLAGTPATTNCIQSSGSTFQIRGSGDFYIQTATMGSAALTVTAGQIGLGSTTATASHCISLATACLVINVGGTTRYVPYY